jgi:hypothetical protein
MTLALVRRCCRVVERQLTARVFIVVFGAENWREADLLTYQCGQRTTANTCKQLPATSEASC